jgi:hypothetical protein
MSPLNTHIARVGGMPTQIVVTDDIDDSRSRGHHTPLVSQNRVNWNTVRVKLVPTVSVNVQFNSSDNYISDTNACAL